MATKKRTKKLVTARPRATSAFTGTSPNKVRLNEPMQVLDEKHPIYLANKDRWETNENRLAGGDNIIDELDPFDWEIETGKDSHLQKRKDKAVYLNFPDIFMTVITGHLLRFAPRPESGLDFAEMGKVHKKRNFSNPTQAEQIWFNVDGPNNIGTEWNQWWMDTLRLAASTGHRWVYVEGPSEDAGTKEREKQGYRPWACEYSPLDVWNWGFDQQGKLLYAVIRFIDWETRFDSAGIANSSSTSEAYQHYLLLTTEGVTKYGAEYSGGGWFKFTPDKVKYDEGDWEDTDGEIPFFPFFYERSKGTKKIPAMSRAGTTELGNAAISFMNVNSAGNFESWDGGKGIEWLSGVDEDGMDLVTGQLKRGDRYIGVPANQDTDLTPQVYASKGQTAVSSSFSQREQAIIATAAMLGIGEALGNTGAGNTQNTGANTAALFTAGQVPRIVRVAKNLESAQNTALYFFGRRYGHDKPSASLIWPDRFDLVELQERIKSFFETQRLAGIRSQTLDAKAMTQFAEEKGLIVSDDDRTKVEAEFEKSSKQANDAQVQALASSLARPGSAGGPMKAGKQAAQDKSRRASQKVDGQRKQNPGTRPRNKKS